MKNLFLLGFAVILFTACNNKPERFSSSSANIDEVKALVADYNAGNWDSWATHYADTAKIYHNTWDKSSTPKEISEALKGLLANTSSYGFAEKNSKGKPSVFYEQTISDDGFTWVNFWGDWRGTLTANGQEIEIPVHLTCHMENGKIVEEYAFYNIAEFNAAMQAIEAAKSESEETNTTE